MTRPKNTDRRAALLEQRRVIDEQLRKMDARDRERERKDDTRRKVIAGALALEDLEKNPHSPFAARLRELLHEYVEPRSRHLFEFLPSLGVRVEAKVAAQEMMAPSTAPEAPDFVTGRMATRPPTPPVGGPPKAPV